MKRKRIQILQDNRQVSGQTLAVGYCSTFTQRLRACSKNLLRAYAPQAPALVITSGACWSTEASSENTSERKSMTVRADEARDETRDETRDEKRRRREKGKEKGQSVRRRRADERALDKPAANPEVCCTNHMCCTATRSSKTALQLTHHLFAEGASSPSMLILAEVHRKTKSITILKIEKYRTFTPASRTLYLRHYASENSAAFCANSELAERLNRTANGVLLGVLVHPGV